MLARVNYDPFELDAVMRLASSLKDENIHLILDSKYTDKENPVLNYINPHIRIPYPARVHSFHKNAKFNMVMSRNVPVSISSNLESTNFIMQDSYYFEKPSIDVLPIFMVTHSRSLYLELTLNSLFYNLSYDKEVPVHILMSQPTEEVRSVVAKFKKIYSNLFTYETETNVCFSATNILLQHLKPKNFMILEEDFILPQNLKSIMPYWVRIFHERLKYFDLVGFSTSIENSNSKYFSYEESVQKKPFIYTWHNLTGIPKITGNTLTTSMQNYLKCSTRNPPFYITPDGVLFKNSRWSICSITGYHIGFNQEMDYAIQSLTTRFPNPEDKQILIDYQRNEKFTYTLSDIYKLIEI